ncbi:type II toxin-antitoxin system VapC family toxin [Conexibacter sp. CPCC 206217]|uniref:type II toxin-antitoxin system VapC family toxin n=1 Tax=Conexibacter sp. CPCC 206217 TaxID=3064574 RepID=UPI002728C3CF|nr:type II toxin-antitoxin system VapC family toxin [Conexibacter sp. CPCC 206217]MDO8211206.1 type II toxin-antitoxin system VapC family toxin [Conexibacter sp. CPCC 206217]
MIVADASAVVEVLLARPAAAAVRAQLAAHGEVHVPEHFHVEVLSVLRRYALRRELSDRRAAVALGALYELRAVRYPVMQLADTIWELRDNLSTYDAAYVALARRLDVQLLTLDGGLAASARVDGRLAELN